MIVYNEIDPFAAAWLRELIKANMIAPGEVWENDIRDIRPIDLRGVVQFHGFAGIGVWSYALRRAGWPDERPVWTMSCPCQPFSAAGAGAGFADERHLWPHAHWLIRECRPPVVAGEQVASKDADAWIDLVQNDLEAMGYAFGAVPFPSASVGAPHIRDRDYWMAYADGRDASAEWQQRGRQQRQQQEDGRRSVVASGGLDDDDDAGLEGQRRGYQTESGHGPGPAQPAAPAGQSGGVGNAAEQPRERFTGSVLGAKAEIDGQRVAIDGPVDLRFEHASPSVVAGPGPTNGFWRDADWLFCRDGKWRPVEPGTFPLAHGAAARVGRLRGYGNAINAVQAQIFIETVIETIYPEIDAGPVDAVRLEELFA